MSDKKQIERRTAAERVVGVLFAWRDMTRAFEQTLVDNIAATVPWLGPVIPAYIAWTAMTGVLKFPAWVAAVGAVVVEFLGLATVTTTVQFWDYNDKRTQKDGEAPFALALVAAAFYLTVVIIVNVLLDDQADIVQRLAKALLSTLSVVAAVTLAVRGQHARRLTERAQERAEQREERREAKLLKMQLQAAGGGANSQKVAGKVSERADESPRKYARWQDVLLADKREVVTWIREARVANGANWKKAVVQRIEATFGQPERNAYAWIEYALRDFATDLSTDSVTDADARKEQTDGGAE